MKTPIRRLDSLTHNDTAATKLINDNFEALQQGVEDALSRTGKKPNFMDDVLDMNMHRIINIADPVDDYDLANKHYVDEADAILRRSIEDEANARQQADNILSGAIETLGNSIGNGTITLTQGGVSKGSFTTNQSNNTTIELDAGETGSGVITIRDVGSVTWTHAGGTTGALINLSSFVGDGLYAPFVVFAKESELDKIYSACNYKNKVLYVYHNGTESYTCTVDSIILIPVSEEHHSGLEDAVPGLTNGHYQTVVPYYNKSEAQPLLVSGTNIKTLNGESLLGSGNITIDSDNGIIAIHEFYMDEAVPTEATGLKTIVHNMASYVEDGVEYMPMFIARTHFEKMSRTIQYDSSTKYIRIYYYHTYGTQDRMYGTLYMIPVDRQGSDSGTLKGLTNGMLVVDEGTWETGVLQTTSNLVTSVSSASTDEQYPSAKLFYDTCGDIETLINAL